MKALADHHRPEEIARLGRRAGIDVFLACHRPETTLELYRGLVQTLEREDVESDGVLRAEERVLAWRSRWYRPPSEQHPPADGWPAHRELARAIEAADGSAGTKALHLLSKRLRLPLE